MHHAVSFLVASLVLTLSHQPSAADGAAPVAPGSAAFEERLTAYYACDMAATAGVLTRSQTDGCRALYTELKLSFLPDGMSRAEYRALPPTERAVANQTAYRGLKDWEAANPVRVEVMRLAAQTCPAGF